MGAQPRFYIQFMKSTLESKKKNNSAYSLRAFANSIGIDSSLLSRVLNRKEHFTIETADKVAKNLNLEIDIRKQFVQSAAEGRACRAIYKASPELTDC